MNGKEFLNKFWFLIFAAFLFIPKIVYADIKGQIAILLSDDEIAYSAPVTSFVNEIDRPYKVYNLEGKVENAPQVMEELFSTKPSLLFALGAKAAFVSKIWTTDQQDIPVVFALVLNWQRYHLIEGHKNIAGIASEVDPGTEFANLAMVSPQIRRIGVIYSEEHSGARVEKARKAATALGLELVAKPIKRPDDFKRVFRHMTDKIDGFLILADPVLYTLDNISWLEKKCINAKIVCIGQSKNVASMGILLAVDPDFVSIGSQAASVAKNILLRRQKPEKIGVRPPLGTRLYLNMKTAKKIGLDINQAALDLASEIIDR